MGFFDKITPEPSNLLAVARRSEAFAPRGSMLARTLPDEQIIVRNSSTTVALSKVEAWKSNLTLEVTFFSRFPLSEHQSLMFYGDQPRPRMGLPSPDGPRIAIVFSDGRYATNLREPGYPRSHERGLSADFPVLTLVSSGGGGGGSPAGGFWHFRQVLDLWPLPPTGSVKVIFAWQAENIAEQTIELSGDEIADAASRCVDVFA